MKRGAALVLLALAPAGCRKKDAFCEGLTKIVGAAQADAEHHPSKSMVLFADYPRDQTFEALPEADCRIAFGVVVECRLRAGDKDAAYLRTIDATARCFPGARRLPEIVKPSRSTSGVTDRTTRFDTGDVAIVLENFSPDVETDLAVGLSIQPQVPWWERWLHRLGL